MDWTSKYGITRRDFLNGTQLTIGAAITAPILSACGVPKIDNPFALANGYYPPSKTGLRGNHEGSWEVMHAAVSGKTWPEAPISEHYDLVIVGGGLSGLSAAYFYSQREPAARILILDNHDDFGGHAKRNEFEIDGQIRIGYGGTEAIDTPSAYSPEARQLLKDIGVVTQRFYDYFDQDFWDRHNLSKSIFFDKETFGVDKLVPGYGSRPWTEFAADMPVSDKAKADFIRVQTSETDYLPNLSNEEKFDLLSRTSYETFLREYCQLDEEIIKIYQRWGMSFWGIGIDEIPTTLIQSYDGGMPGVAHTIPRTGHRNDEPYIFHFPDGNASLARLLVRAMNPQAVPGSTMEDVVTTQLDYSRLDRHDNPVNIRLNSTVIKTINNDDKVEISYIRNGQPHKISANNAIMACYNMAIPAICPETPPNQVDALSKGIKLPIVYTKVLIPDWHRFANIGTDFIYYPSGFYKQAEFAYPVSIGDYQGSMEPDMPMILHMCHVPWVPNVKGPEQWKTGRARMLQMPYETYEHHVFEQLESALADHDFKAERDIRAITVNRWSHGYAYSPDYLWEPEYRLESDKPWIKGRAPIGRIHIANSDAAASATTNAAITQAFRAVNEIFAG